MQQRELAQQTELAFSDQSYIRDQLITCIGNKRRLLTFIENGVKKVKKRLGKDRLRSLDVFSGSGVVARLLKGHSSYLHANDLEKYVAVTNKCYLSNRSEVNFDRLKDVIRSINETADSDPDPGFISELYAPEDDTDIKEGERAFYTTRNAQFIDTARKQIEGLDNSIKPYVLAPLIYKASVHTNTSGVFKGFHKDPNTGIGQYGGGGEDALHRILTDIYIPPPVLSNHECDYKVTQKNANEAVREAGSFDLAYIDPPYNQHPYGSNYFMLNLIAEYERPENISRVSGIPKDWNRSPYNKKRKIHDAFDDLISHTDAKCLLVSFNSEGFISTDEMLSLLGQYGNVEAVSTKYNTFRGSMNLDQRDLYVEEYLYLVEKS